MLPRVTNFNSIKVQLEQGHAKHSRYVRGNFNSIKVQLEQKNASSIYFDSSFQFHKGTIRTLHSFFQSLDIREFQFHKGTIRTRGLIA